MNIIWFIIGVFAGFGIKLGFDYYHEFLKEERNRADRMEDVLVRFKAIELNKQ